MKSNKHAKIHYDLTEYHTGKGVVYLRLVFAGGTYDGDGRAIVAEEPIVFQKTYQGCRLRGFLKLWLDSPAQEELRLVKKKLASLTRESSIAKLCVRKEVMKEIRNELLDETFEANTTPSILIDPETEPQ